jgi:hypothetical protein
MLAGVVQEIYPPSHKSNKSKTQYEYLVAAASTQNSHQHVHCILQDKFGGINDFETYTLKTGQRVVVQCIQGYTENGIILGGIKNFTKVTDESLGHHWTNRFNKITSGVTKDDVHYIKHDDGNEIRIEPTKIKITDGEKLEVTIDKANKNITISDGSGESIVIDQKSKKITIKAKDLNLEVKGNLKAKVSGDCDVKAKNIKLNGSGGKVVTTKTWPVDPVTGIKVRGVGSVKSG